MDVTADGVPVDTLIRIIKSAITRSGLSGPGSPGSGSPGPVALRGDLLATSAQVTLQVVASMSAGGEMSFCVPFLGLHLGGGGKLAHQVTHTIDMTLEPRERAAGPRAVSADEVEDVLVNAIAAIRATMVAAAGDGDPWGLSTATVDIGFAVTRSGTISLGIDGGLEREVTNTLRLTLRPG